MAVWQRERSAVTRDAFDVYVTILRDTNELNTRRRQLDSLYVTLITFILSGEAFVAFNSTFTDWLFVAVVVGISWVGITVNSRWRDGARSIDEILEHRYKFLRSLETQNPFTYIGATFFSDEWKSFYSKRTDAKSADAKSADAKSADAKSADAKSADAKRVDKKFRTTTGRLQRTFTAVFILIPLSVIALTAINTIPSLHDAIPPYVLQHIQPLAMPTRQP